MTFVRNIEVLQTFHRSSFKFHFVKQSRHILIGLVHVRLVETETPREELSLGTPIYVFINIEDR